MQQDFSALLVKEIPFLRRFARALAGDAALADDLVQDCVERALRKQHLYDQSRPLRAWLYAILRNIHSVLKIGLESSAYPVSRRSYCLS